MRPVLTFVVEHQEEKAEISLSLPFSDDALELGSKRSC
jgi:hypothetical protein